MGKFFPLDSIMETPEQREEKIWIRKSRARIAKAILLAGRMSLRDLKRKTHYNRGSIGAWHDAADALERAGVLHYENQAGERAKLDYSEGRIFVVAGK